MATPNSPLHICNMMLDLLNQPSITQLSSPETATEKLCARWYDQVRRTTLRKHTWNFALKRISLAALSEAPVSDYSAQFQLPSDFLRILDIGERNAQEVDYEIENGNLLLNAEGPVYIRYVYNIETVSQFDPLFIEVFAAELALKLSGKFGKSANEKAELKSYIDDLKEEAHAIDGQERPPTVVNRSRLMAARRGFHSRRNDIVGD